MERGVRLPRNYTLRQGVRPVSLVLLWLICMSGPGFCTDDPLANLGRSLYRDGALPSGAPIRGTVQGDIPVSGTQLACVSCHRRSGLGGSEGRNLTPPVTGRALYTAREKHYREWPTPQDAGLATRPAYTDATLRRALREGIDAAGRPLSPLMPRYALDDTQLDALIAYLKVLGTEPPPGISADFLHLSTIVTPDVKPESSESMLQVLQAFFDDKNARTRNEPGRAAHAPWHQDWKFEAYRQIRLHVWTLEGSAESWAAQLEARYTKQPVFAVVSGIGSGEWEPIHRFCETHALPCLFPNTLLPESDGEGFYSVYFNRGMELEGRVAAHYLNGKGIAQGPVLQIYTDTPADRAAARTLRESLQQPPVELRISSSVSPTDVEKYNVLLSQHRPRAVVLWGDGPQLHKLLWSTTRPVAEPCVYLVSASRAASALPPLNPEIQKHLYAIQPYALLDQPARGEARIRAWLRSRALEPIDMRTAMNAYFAATVTTGAINMLFDRFSREYLIERIEHSTENALTSGAYPYLSLGPDQRYAAKGAYVVQLSGGRDHRPQLAEWVVP